MSRGRYIALAVVACLIGGVVLAWQHLSQDDPARATLDEALERFRERGAAAGEGPGGAALGVYRYRTQGSETADTGFLSATHDYDGISTITLTKAPCGVLERWQVLVSRWSEAEFCLPPNGTGLKGITEFHEFFGTGREDSYRCHGDSPSKQLLRRVGTHFTSRCASDSGTAKSASRVVAVEQVTVAGDEIDAIHTVSRVVLGGDVSGSTTREDWRRRSDGLLLRRTVEAEARMSGAVGADYVEKYTIDLLAVDPQR